jgi:transcription-repair coupling factor (superfamily II helicase)
VLKDIKKILYESPCFKKLNTAADGFIFQKVNGSLNSFIVDYFFAGINKKIIIISGDAEKLLQIRDDLELINGGDNILYPFEKGNENEELTKSLKCLSREKEFIVFVTPRDLEKTTIDKKRFSESIIEIQKGQEYRFEKLIHKLEEFKFEKNDFVEKAGDYSVRGGIVDLFPEYCDVPLRIEFFGDTVESIREFDITTQRSIKEIKEMHIGFNLNVTAEGENILENGKSKITDYIPEDALLVIDETDTLENTKLKNKKCYFSSFSSSVGENIIDFRTNTQPDFHANVKTLFANIQEHINENYQAFILCSDEYQVRRMESLILECEDEEQKQSLLKAKILPQPIQGGFLFNESKLLVYTEHQIFNRYFRQTRKKRKRFRGLTFEEIKELRRGDYVVHRDFGIGLFKGLTKIKTRFGEQEVVSLSYGEGDSVFVNLNYINLIKKYSGTEGYTPKLTRLGGGEWEKLKDKTRKKVKTIARDLIILYAKRKSESGHVFPADTHWQRELEAGFMYEDTPDQIIATEEVKIDMMSENPMDRLVCGDVGFGKTEIAVRAAFKAVLDNKQVAILVPTTILAFQHFNTFRDRLSSFAVEVGLLTRMQTRKEQKEVLEKLEEGKINIIIGTHRILTGDLIFKDIGLLVIDEEQRFGVKAKEKLKTIKPNIDTLTLTATPIPRTLNFSLLGARDLSIINTPPKNRKPIITEIINLDWKLIKEIILKELNRKGQIYFVNDKISNLDKLKNRIKTEIPALRLGVAHGQMDARELEDEVINFIEKKTDLLLCTKIIESGLDIPNVNTIIINNANMYGLAELYQLRGRVGRSEVQAYSYFIAPPASNLTRTAIRRLQAIEEYTELGSGFNLAMRDMEIRGVGNLLGKEQSGFVQQIGFEMYIDIIDEAVSELKENEFKDLFKDEKSLKKISDRVKEKSEETSTIIENDINAIIPKDYIQNDTERLNIYKRLYDSKSADEISLIKGELRDRFGEYLEDVENLLELVEIKIKASATGIEKINISDNLLTVYFPQDKTHKIFKGSFFEKLLDEISKDKKDKFRIESSEDRLIIEMTFEGIDDKIRLKETAQLINIAEKELN